MATKEQLLESVRGRKTRTGIITADRYFRDVQGCFDGGICPVDKSICTQDQWLKSLKESESKLTYTNSETEFIKGSISQPIGSGLAMVEVRITTPKRDRDGDVLLTEGADLDMKSPFLWQHIPMQPIGGMAEKTRHTKDELCAKFVIADVALGRDTLNLIKAGALRISHGFDPIKFKLMEDEEGWLFEKFLIFEVSGVSIPSNTDAGFLSVAEKGFESEFAKTFYGRSPIIIKAKDDSDQCRCKEHNQGASEGEEIPEEVHPKTKAMSKEFDVERQHIEASKLEYDWISRFCSCEVKQLVNFHTFSSRIKMGSFLTGLKSSLSESSEVDVRRLTYNGLESPPQYETIQLNSKASDHFLVGGISFRKTPSGACFAVKYERDWNGEHVELFCAKKDAGQIDGILGKAWKWAEENNFLKGEAFSLDGEFLPRKGLEWGELFLDSGNEKEVRSAVDLMNKKGKDCPNRGQVYLGPPGTGKTMSARLVKDNTQATFIWVGGKQAYYYGGINSVISAFELAKELSPAVVLFEDIDASLSSDYAIDVLKTEMDGIGKGSGVLTILTTNHPKSFPEALLDRPGRFHDVLKFDLPAEGIRRKMIEKWLPGIDAKTAAETAKETDGYSGAHVYELCQYAKNISDMDETEVGDAIKKAMDKIKAQRELIDEELCRDRTIASRRRQAEVFTKSGQITKTIGEAILKLGKAGSRLSQSSRSEIANAIADIEAILETENLPRSVTALANSAVSCLNTLVGGGEDDEKSIENLQRKYIAMLAFEDRETIKSHMNQMSSILNASEELEDANQWESLFSQIL